MLHSSKLIFIKKQIFCAVFIVFLLACINTNAQSKIKGKVINETGHPVANANVLLIEFKDSSLVKGIVTEPSGTYQFENISAGKYLITTSYTGFSQKYSSPISISSDNKNVDVPSIRLSEKVAQLSDVTVVTKKPLFEQKMDRMVVNVANSITSAGNTALEVLQRSPGIIVDPQNNTLSMNGKDGVVVMINGKINRMPITAVVQMLAGMSANNIERIELITT
ncbi:MAG: carboxypeptidase-like regulatory domain-containing protein, partial [Segetibacter sp.]